MAEEEDFWKQKARVKWAVEGDRCTKFFHASVLAKRQRLTITKIKNAEGQWLTSDNEVREQAVHFYQALFQAEHRDPVLEEDAIQYFLSFIPTQITEAVNLSLLRPVTIEEIKGAVFQMDPESAPSSDGDGFIRPVGTL